MSNEILAAVGTSLTNIGGAITECVRQRTAGSPPPVEHFDLCLGTEILRLRGLGEDGLAAALQGVRSPLARLMTEGW